MPIDPIENPLPPAPEGVPAAPVVAHPVQREQVTCEFCGCTLTPHGHALKLSDTARGFRDQREALSRANAKIAELETELGRVQRDLAAADAKLKDVDRKPASMWS